jgi:hypothetical protein
MNPRPSFRSQFRRDSLWLVMADEGRSIARDMHGNAIIGAARTAPL